MAFGSNDFPLGPNGSFPRQRIRSAGNEIASPEAMEGIYSMSGSVKLPVVERDFTSSLNKVKNRMSQGKIMREGQDVDKFRPKHAGKSKVKGDNWLRQRGNKFSGL